MATDQTSGGWIYDSVNGVKVDEATALNGQSRVLEIKQTATSASTDATRALQTANSYAGQIAQANTTAGSAVAIAEGAASDVDEIKGPIDTRLTAVETAAGYAPGDATDAAMANVATQEDTQFRAALNAQSVGFADSFLGMTVVSGVLTTASLNAAAVQAKADGRKLVAAGILEGTETLTIDCDCDLSTLEYRYSGTGTAVISGVTTAGSFVSRVDRKLPRVVNTAKVGTGWGTVAGSIGVLISNVYTGTIEVPYVRNFETGLQLQGIGAGVSYVKIPLGHLSNNKRNLRAHAGRVGAGSMGWVNQNMFIGGRLSHDSNEGVVVPGTVQLLADTADGNPIWVNHNIFDNVSIESVNVVEWHVDWNGHFNYFDYCRWENVGAKPRVMWRANTLGNEIYKGNNAHDIEVTKESGTANSIYTYGTSDEVTSPGSNEASHYYENKVSSNAPIFRFMGAGAAGSNKDRKTQWLTEITSNAIKGKREADAHPRTLLDHTNGRMYFGNGTDAATTYIGKVGVMLDLGGQVMATTAPATPSAYIRVMVNGTQYRLPLMPDTA